MSDPFSLLPLALAGRGGSVDEYEIQQLVAAGLTLLQRSAALVRALSGKRSAILLPTSPQFFVALAASEGRGAVLVNPLASRYEIAHQLRDANVGAVFTNSSLAAHLPPGTVHVLLDDAPRQVRVVAATTRDVDLGSHLGLSVEGETNAPASTEEAAIVYTSAMHGVPLGAVLTHANLLANARATVIAGALTENDRALALLPFSHLFGLIVAGAAPLLAGGRIVTAPRFNPARAVEIIASEAITMVVGVPTVFRALLAVLERHPVERGALRLCICGGAPLERSLQDAWYEATGCELRQGYGLTEAGPVCLFNRSDRENVRATLGVPFPGVEVRLADDGEILVRGENVFRGYVSRGECGLQVRDEWLHTGDAGSVGPAGTIVFDRVLKPMFTRNGFNIYPRELEAAAREIDGVRSAAVEAVAVEHREPDIALRYTGSASPETVRAWCLTRLSAYKQPTTIERVGG